MSCGPCRLGGHAKSVRLRLYVASGTPQSAAALANLEAVCTSELPDRHHIEVVDVVKEPERPFQDGVYLTPTLVRLAPEPQWQIVGTLHDLDALRQFLGLLPGRADR